MKSPGSSKGPLTKRGLNVGRISGEILFNLKVDAQVDFFVGTVDIDYILVVDQIFQNESRDIKADDVGIRYDVANGCGGKIDIEIFRFGATSAKSVCQL